MTPIERRVPLALATAAIVAGCAVLTGVLLSLSAVPDGFDARMARLSGRAALAERLIKRDGGDAPSPPLGLCPGGPAAQLQALKNDVTGAAGRLDLSATAVDVRFAPAGDDRGVTPIVLQFEVSGSYAGAMALLDGLAKRRPAVFVDSVHLVSKTSTVSFSFAGKVLCVA